MRECRQRGEIRERDSVGVPAVYNTGSHYTKQLLFFIIKISFEIRQEKSFLTYQKEYSDHCGAQFELKKMSCEM